MEKIIEGNTELEILRGNLLICNFMYEGIIAARAQYHSSWDSLMPVVEKIWKFNCDNNIDDSIYRVLDIFDMRVWATIQEVYSAVIEFIEWYNLKNK